MRDAVRRDPAATDVTDVAAREVRVLCPRGHFIANVLVIAVDERGILLRPRGRDKQWFDHDVFNDPNHGFRFDINPAKADPPRLKVRMHCQRPQCGYNGSFDYDTLSVELADAVSAGRPEHRLTN